MQDVFYNIILPPLIDECIDLCNFTVVCSWKRISTRCWKLIQHRWRESYKRLFVSNNSRVTKNTLTIIDKITHAFVEDMAKIILFTLHRIPGNTFLLQHFAQRFQGRVYICTNGERQFNNFQKRLLRPVERWKIEKNQVLEDNALLLINCDNTKLIRNIICHSFETLRGRYIIATGMLEDDDNDWNSFDNVCYVDGRI